MEKINMISRVIMSVITFILFSIMIINEDSSWNFVPVIFTLIVFGCSFPSTIYAEKIIEMGNKINNKLLKIVYYVFLPIILLVICFIICKIVVYIVGSFFITPNQALLLLFIVAVMVVIIILPSVQAIIINILKKILKQHV